MDDYPEQVREIKNGGISNITAGILCEVRI
jgi:hypothetical protein